MKASRNESNDVWEKINTIAAISHFTFLNRSSSCFVNGLGRKKGKSHSDRRNKWDFYGTIWYIKVLFSRLTRWEAINWTKLDKKEREREKSSDLCLTFICLSMSFEFLCIRNRRGAICNPANRKLFAVQINFISLVIVNNRYFWVIWNESQKEFSRNLNHHSDGKRCKLLQRTEIDFRCYDTDQP